ncbi:MAG: hypothetical protein NUV67_01185 [archaeon]|nr:hypothetical protein [archaeon]
MVRQETRVRQDLGYSCMNCKSKIENPEGDLYSRRFCSVKCKEQYLGY